MQPSQPTPQYIPVKRSSLNPLSAAYAELADDLALKAQNSNHNPTLQEACYRSAIGRAYYAVFHHARTYLSKNHGINLGRQGGGGGGSHSRLQSELRRLVKTPEGRDSGVAHKFGQIKETRESAEYDTVFPQRGANIAFVYNNFVRNVNTIIDMMP